MNISKDLDITEKDKKEEINERFYDKSLEKKEITPDISEKLFSLNNYYNLVSLIRRDYSDSKNKHYFNKYYCINSKWMFNFLELYNYKKIKTLIGEFRINSEEELYMKIKEKGINTSKSWL